jgi:putative membrane protein
MKIITPFTMPTVIAIVLSVMLSVPVFAQQTSTLSDAEVASVAVVANQIDVSYGEIAKQRSKNEDVLKFAETMISDHKAVIAQAVTLTKKLSVTPKDNAVSQKLLADADKTKKALISKSGKVFDKAYIDNEVAYHKAVIAAVENLLIPETENEELKDLLENVVPALKTHLEHAIMVQNKISN